MSVKLKANLEFFPRETLTRTPTPLDKLEHLSKHLGMQLWLKRDDLTDLAMGGDKPRKLEYELAQARLQDADVIVTCGSAQSNHARLTSAAARKLGFDCCVVLSSDGNTAFQGNLLLTKLMGSEVHLSELKDHWALNEVVEELMASLKAQGRKPYFIPVSGTTPHSCLGYVRAGFELAMQLRENKLSPDALYLPFGTGGIFSALLLSLRSEGFDFPLIGISVNQKKAVCIEQLEYWWEKLSELLEQNPNAPKGAFELYDSFVGQAYGDATTACLDAVSLMARKEGILLDPVYSGKVFAGLLAQQTAKQFSNQSQVLMLHSGGSPALFAYHKELEKHFGSTF